MAVLGNQIQIQDLPPVTLPLAGTEPIPIVQNGITKKVTALELAGAISGTVTSVSVVTANGISGTVATPTTTPAITLDLGNITPNSVDTGNLTSSGINTFSGLNTQGFVTTNSSGVLSTGVIHFELVCNIVGHVINTTIYLDPKAYIGYTIIEVFGIQTTSGTVTAALNINGSPITGLSAISVNSSPQDVIASAANVVAAGNALTLVLSSGASPTDLRFTLGLTRDTA